MQTIFKIPTMENIDKAVLEFAINWLLFLIDLKYIPFNMLFATSLDILIANDLLFNEGLQIQNGTFISK